MQDGGGKGDTHQPGRIHAGQATVQWISTGVPLRLQPMALGHRLEALHLVFHRLIRHAAEQQPQLPVAIATALPVAAFWGEG